MTFAFATLLLPPNVSRSLCHSERSASMLSFLNKAPKRGAKNPENVPPAMQRQGVLTMPVLLINVDLH